MWDLATLKKLNEQREKLLRDQREKAEGRGKVIRLDKRPKQTA